jgi:hypothetical protein
MNTKLALTAIVMFAVIMGVSAISPATAAKQPKSDVCHFESEEIDPVTGEVTPAFWTIININGNALKAHVDKHGDGITSDFVIETAQDDLDCRALPNFQETVDEE